MNILRVEAPQKGTASAILLHGMTESSAQTELIARELHSRPTLKHVNFVLPNAPLRKVTAFNGQAVQTWFDTNGIGTTNIEEFTDDVNAVDETLQFIEELISEEVHRGIPRSRIVVGGFSAGAGMTLAMAISSAHKLAGFVALSGFIPTIKHLETIAKPTNRDTPLLVVNGTADKAVRFVTAEAGLKLLLERFLFTDVKFRVFEGLQHRVGPESIGVTGDFLEAVIR